MDDFFGIGPVEILVVLVVAVIALGPAKMMEIGKGLGKLMGTLKKASYELNTQVNKELEQEKSDQLPNRKSSPDIAHSQSQVETAKVSSAQSEVEAAKISSVQNELEAVKARLEAAEAKLKSYEATGRPRDN